MSNLPNPADVFSDDHPIINEGIEAITFGGVIPVNEIPRDRAARILNMWAHRGTLTSREVDAILAHFPKTPAHNPEILQVRWGVQVWQQDSWQDYSQYTWDSRSVAQEFADRLYGGTVTTRLFKVVKQVDD